MVDTVDYFILNTQWNHAIKTTQKTGLKWSKQQAGLIRQVIYN